AQHALFRGRHHRQAVRPAAFESRLELILVVAECYAARCQSGFLEADQQVFDPARLDVQSAAAWLESGQPGADALEAAYPFPLRAIPAMGAIDVASAGTSYQRRNDLDAKH